MTDGQLTELTDAIQSTGERTALVVAQALLIGADWIANAILRTSSVPVLQPHQTEVEARRKDCTAAAARLVRDAHSW